MEGSRSGLPLYPYYVEDTRPLVKTTDARSGGWTGRKLLHRTGKILSKRIVGSTLYGVQVLSVRVLVPPQVCV